MVTIWMNLLVRNKLVKRISIPIPFFTCLIIDWQGDGDSGDKGRNYYYRS
jgi:hypothetical protein